MEKGADPRTVQDTCREASVLLDEALACSRTLTGELSPPILHAAGFIPAMEWLSRWMQEKHGLAVILKTDDRAVPANEALTLLLFKSVRELLFNVLKHAQISTAHLEVTQADGYLNITLADSGVGFEVQRVFESAKTSGFGLFSIRQRLEFLGGRMDIDSAPGRGCRITLSVPFLHALSADQRRETVPEGAESVRVSEPAPSAGRRIRVLLVDDHTVVRQALAKLLEAEPDLEVIGAASDGKMAVEMTGTLRPDMVLMDISMPVMDGIEATRAIHAEFPDVRIIGLSMFDARERAAAIRAAGAIAYVSKSDPSGALLTAIRACAFKKTFD